MYRVVVLLPESFRGGCSFGAGARKRRQSLPTTYLAYDTAHNRSSRRRHRHQPIAKCKNFTARALGPLRHDDEIRIVIGELAVDGHHQAPGDEIGGKKDAVREGAAGAARRKLERGERGVDA